MLRLHVRSCHWRKFVISLLSNVVPNHELGNCIRKGASLEHFEWGGNEVHYYADELKEIIPLKQNNKGKRPQIWKFNTDKGFVAKSDRFIDGHLDVCVCKCMCVFVCGGRGYPFKRRPCVNGNIVGFRRSNERTKQTWHWWDEYLKKSQNKYLKKTRNRQVQEVRYAIDGIK